jgi:hypothetical protein
MVVYVCTLCTVYMKRGAVGIHIRKSANVGVKGSASALLVSLTSLSTMVLAIDMHN